MSTIVKKKRIFQIAKELNISHLEILNFLESNGSPVDSHMSPVSPEQYDEILESRNGKDSMEYFHSLSTDNKVTYLKQLKNIHKYNKNNIPLRFKILNSNMDLETKVIAINNIDTFDEMDTSSGEYYKMEQWINGLVKVPFGIYKQLSISDTDAIKDQREFFNNTSLTNSFKDLLSL